MYNVLNNGTTDVRSGTPIVSGTPFFVGLSEDGGNGDFLFNENYAAPQDIYWTVRRNLYLKQLIVSVGRGAVALGANNLSTGWLRNSTLPLTNGITFWLKDSSGNVIQAINDTGASLTYGEFQLLTTESALIPWLLSGTSGTNEIVTYNCIGFAANFGASLFCPMNSRIGFTLNDDFTTNALFKAYATGYFD